MHTFIPDLYLLLFRTQKPAADHSEAPAPEKKKHVAPPAAEQTGDKAGEDGSEKLGGESRPVTEKSGKHLPVGPLLSVC